MESLYGFPSSLLSWRPEQGGHGSENQEKTEITIVYTGFWPKIMKANKNNNYFHWVFAPQQ